jgi:apolipoprotein D and lipocalin family protein
MFGRRSALRTLLTFVVLAPFAGGCTHREPSVATDLDLERFQGSWYEIARIPRDHDRLCHDTTADYRLVAPGKLELWHRCRLSSATGSLSEFRAPATVDDPEVPAKLTLDLGLYRGSYWVLEVGKDYEYALIGHPSLTMLWVLARAPSLPSETLRHVEDRASREGFSANALEMTPQSASP